MIYNHKSEDIIQDIVTENIYPIIEDIESEYMGFRRNEALYIYVPSNIAREILSELLEDLDDVYVDADSKNELLYDDKNKVLITLAYDGMIFIEDAYGEHNLKDADAEMNYVHDSFPAKEVKNMSRNCSPILVFGTNEDAEDCDKCDCDCEKCGLKESGTKETSVSKDKVIYKVNDKECTKEEYFKAVQKFDEQFKDILHDGLIQHCRIMDSFNDLLNAFRW